MNGLGSGLLLSYKRAPVSRCEIRVQSSASAILWSTGERSTNRSIAREAIFASGQCNRYPHPTLACPSSVPPPLLPVT